MKIAVAGSTGLIGSQVVELAANAGHEVLGLSLSAGFDLLTIDPAVLATALDGVDAVVNVTQSPTLDEAEASTFFATTARNLGTAATTAGVGRSVVLSIVGADKSPDYGYYVAKVVQEDVTRATAPGAQVVRATQFHEFAGQMLMWNRDGDVVRIIDVPLQPVASSEIARLLLEAATGVVDGDVDLAGPRAESLVDLVERLIAHEGLDVKVETVDAPPSMASGSMLPGSGALLRGPDWETWIQTR